MLQLSGFEVEAIYGGFEGELFNRESDHLIALARPQGIVNQLSFC